MERDFWNNRYAIPGFAYGDAPNTFFADHVSMLPRDGKILFIADGEGRNSVYAAQLGCDVVSVDFSKVAGDKAQKLAASKNVRIETVTADLAAFDFAQNKWAGVVSIFCHLPPDLRTHVHEQIVANLRPGGVVLLKAYHPDQIALNTGGPRDPALMMTVDQLRKDFGALEIQRLEKVVRDVREGEFHAGMGAVVQLIAIKH